MDVAALADVNRRLDDMAQKKDSIKKTTEDIPMRDDKETIDETMKIQLRQVLNFWQFLAWLRQSLVFKCLSEKTRVIFNILIRQDMVSALKQMEAQKKHHIKNNKTLRELNNKIVAVMSSIDGSLNNIMKAVREQYSDSLIWHKSSLKKIIFKLDHEANVNFEL